MDASEIRRRIADIAAHRSDSERAHSEEIQLYKDTLASIALTSTDTAAREKAAAALEAEDVPFGRYTA